MRSFINGIRQITKIGRAVREAWTAGWVDACRKEGVITESCSLSSLWQVLKEASRRAAEGESECNFAEDEPLWPGLDPNYVADAHSLYITVRPVASRCIICLDGFSDDATEKKCVCTDCDRGEELRQPKPSDKSQYMHYSCVRTLGEDATCPVCGVCFVSRIWLLDACAVLHTMQARAKAVARERKRKAGQRARKMARDHDRQQALEARTHGRFPASR
jgi:hypothetical protein